MSNSIRCTNCDFESPLFGLYCSNCGNSLTTRCKVCGEDNLLGAKFCRNCGAQFSTAQVGLYLDRALAWREQFRRMNWWDTPKEKGTALVKSLTEQKQISDTDARYDPWVMFCNIDGSDWKPRLVTMGRQYIQSTGRGDSYVMATRCCLAILDGKEMNSTVIPYTEIASTEWDSQGRVSLKTTKGEFLKWEIKTSGAGLFDVAMAIAATDMGTRNLARRNVEVKTGQQRSFMDLIGEFLREITDVRESQ